MSGLLFVYAFYKNALQAFPDLYTTDEVLCQILCRYDPNAGYIELRVTVQEWDYMQWKGSNAKTQTQTTYQQPPLPTEESVVGA